MKTVRERAEQVAEAVRGNHGRDTLAVVEHVIREVLRDQRYTCAEALLSAPLYDLAAENELIQGVQALVTNAPFPGE